MNWLNAARASFAHMLNGYPRRFREEFAEEIRADFEDLSAEAAQKGTLPLIRVWIRELAWLPLCILRETWHDSQGREMMTMTTAGRPLPASWRESALAGLPHLMIALVALLTLPGGSGGLRTLLWLGLALVSAAGLAAAVAKYARRRKGAWSATWLGYVALIIMIFALLPRQGWNEPLNNLFSGAVGLALPFLGIAALIYWLTRLDPVEAALIALPLILLYWLPAMEFIQAAVHFWLVVGMFAVCGLAAILIARANDIDSAVWLMLGASALLGLPISFARIYIHTYPPAHADPKALGPVLEMFGENFLPGAALALLPLLGWGLWKYRQRFAREGTAAAILMIAGVVLNLLGQFLYWRWFSRDMYYGEVGINYFIKPDRLPTIILVYAGFIATLAGALWMAMLAWRADKRLSLALLPVSLTLPLLAMTSIYFGWHIVLPGMTFEAVGMDSLTRYLYFTIGILLVMLGGWTAVRLHRDPPIVEEAE